MLRLFPFGLGIAIAFGNALLKCFTPLELRDEFLKFEHVL
jgi:hypothetical protein